MKDPSSFVPRTTTCANGSISLIFCYPQSLSPTFTYFPVAVPVGNKKKNGNECDPLKNPTRGQGTAVHKSGWKLQFFHSSQEHPLESQLI